MGPSRRAVAGGLAAGAMALAGRASAQGSPTKFSMGSPMPSAHPITAAMRDATARIRDETGGRYEIEFFPDSQLGSELSMQSQLRSGALDFTATSVSSLQSLVPSVGLPGVAFAFDGYDKLWAGLDDGELGRDARAALAKLKLKAFKVLDNGFRHVITGSTAIEKPKDLAGLKIRVPPSQLLTSLFKLLDASPVTINLAETYAALQTKVADGMENSLPNIEATKVYEVQRFISLTGHSWDGLWILANEASWARLPPDVQAVVERNFDRAVAEQRRAFLDMESTSQQRLKAAGITFVQPDREPFRKALLAAGYYADWKGKFGAESWARLERYSGPLGA